MADIFEVLGVLTVIVLGSTAVAVALAMRSLIRANRVAPGRRSPAPLSWLLSPRLPARLHRRLRRAVRTIGFASATVAPTAVPLREVAADLVSRAVILDDWLVAADGLHIEARMPRLAQLSAEIRELESSAARHHQLSCEWRRCLDHAAAATPIPPPDLHQRMDAVEAALRELPAPPNAAPIHASKVLAGRTRPLPSAPSAS